MCPVSTPMAPSPYPIPVFEAPENCTALSKAWQAAGQTVALVPTMGALHAGHLALIEAAKIRANRVVVSIYVNPLQFGPNEDFDRYPRTFEADLAACVAAGADAVLAPASAMPQAQARPGAAPITQVQPPAYLTQGLCGASRPGHFEGVATVVLQLLNIVQPQVAIFGEKDYQQLCVIKTMAKQLCLPVEIVGHPIVREADGLAMSSRNRYLTDPADRRAALTLYNILFAIQAKLSLQRQLPAQATFQAICRTWLQNDPLTRDRVRLEYLQAVNETTLAPVETLERGVRVMIAANVGLSGQAASAQTPSASAAHASVRLIDNLKL
ncbi:MAG: pantoate--beta-alanine ligase [Vampirovibrionales bacterium]|nr:pantoate--beta-alanine ligase [Vampirovibrionales bacterium]